MRSGTFDGAGHRRGETVQARVHAEQTDMPLLVRVDTERFCAGVMCRQGRRRCFYVFDTVTNSVVDAPRRSLELGAIKPALEGVFDVRTPTGTVKVTTVFERLKEQLKAYTPEQTEPITSINATTCVGWQGGSPTPGRAPMSARPASRSITTAWR